MSESHVTAPPLVTHSAPSALADLKLPSRSENVFQRLIRNPRPDSSLPRERECAEMLASLLLNAPAIRNHLFRWLSALAGIKLPDLDESTFEIRTEQAIGSKRDDIRIEAWDASERRVILWTIEVKVGSWFHESGAQPFDDDEDDADKDTDEPPVNHELVNQIQNYDEWLERQKCVSRAGFVIAMEDTSRWMPSGLCMPWTCTSWTRLGLSLADALRTADLPPAEAFLGAHVLGFIETNLWRNSQMPDFRLDFNDVALIRAYGQLAKETEQKVNALVDVMGAVLEATALVPAEVRYERTLYGRHCRSIARQPLSGNRNDELPTLCAGIGWEDQDWLSVWIQSRPEYAGKHQFRAAIRDQATALAVRKPPWDLPTNAAPWWDLGLTVPLSTLLAERDQTEAVRAFTIAAINDLRSIDLMGIVRRIFP